MPRLTDWDRAAFQPRTFGVELHYASNTDLNWSTGATWYRNAENMNRATEWAKARGFVAAIPTFRSVNGLNELVVFDSRFVGEEDFQGNDARVPWGTPFVVRPEVIRVGHREPDRRRRPDGGLAASHHHGRARGCERGIPRGVPEVRHRHASGDVTAVPVVQAPVPHLRVQAVGLGRDRHRAALRVSTTPCSTIWACSRVRSQASTAPSRSTPRPRATRRAFRRGGSSRAPRRPSATTSSGRRSIRTPCTRWCSSRRATATGGGSRPVRTWRTGSRTTPPASRSSPTTTSRTAKDFAAWRSLIVKIYAANTGQTPENLNYVDEGVVLRSGDGRHEPPPGRRVRGGTRVVPAGGRLGPSASSRRSRNRSSSPSLQGHALLST